MGGYNGIRNRTTMHSTDVANVKFGARLKKLIALRKVSQAELCRKLDLSDAMMYCWVSGRSVMRFSTFAQIADFLNLTTTELTYLLEPYWEDNDG